MIHFWDFLSNKTLENVIGMVFGDVCTLLGCVERVSCNFWIRDLVE